MLVASRTLRWQTGTLYYQQTVTLLVRICEQIIMSNSSTESKPSYVKLAMRNMVQKRLTSLKHFALTTVGLLAVLIGLAYLTR